jgi:hypothetical protein
MKTSGPQSQDFTPAEESLGSVASVSNTTSYTRVLGAFVAWVDRKSQVATGGRPDAWSDKSPAGHAWVNGQVVGDLHPRTAHVYRSYD